MVYQDKESEKDKGSEKNNAVETLNTGKNTFLQRKKQEKIR